ncbi:membrane protein [Bacilli bacterium]|nr:membrane protein [Bacilli bacterium]
MAFMKYANIYSNPRTRAFDSGLRDYMYLIYRNMGAALLVSALTAFIIGSSPFLLSIFVANPVSGLAVWIGSIVVMFSIVRPKPDSTIEEMRNKLLLYACLMGISLSTIFVVYARVSIVTTFLTTAITFGAMSLYGYSTHRDLTGMGSFLLMGIVGILFASIINMFLRSSALSYQISCFGVIIFTLYTAFDVQRFKSLYNNYAGAGEDVTNRLAIMGALQLYMDFINLFLYLLRFLGERNNRRD